MSWPTKKLGKAVLIIIFLIFAGLFFWAKQYWIAFFTIGLVLIGWRFEDVSHFSISENGLQVKLEKAQEKIKEIVRSEKSSEEKIRATQKLVDEIFRLGFRAGGGKFNEIYNVRIHRDEKGNIISIQYDEN